MRGRTAALLSVLAASGCGPRAAPGQPPPLTASQAASVQQQVRAFASAVAEDVTHNGPAAWGRHFADSPAFYMADEGQLVFPNRAAATAAIADLVKTVQHIELQWGQDVRVDVLTANLAGVASPYHEVRVDTAGRRVEERGFFTAVAELQNGRWQFRNAHWSVARPASAAP